MREKEKKKRRDDDQNRENAMKVKGRGGGHNTLGVDEPNTYCSRAVAIKAWFLAAKTSFLSVMKTTCKHRRLVGQSIQTTINTSRFCVSHPPSPKHK